MSSTETRIPLERASALAVEVADLLRPSAARLEAAGSIRRGQPDGGDLELVAIPRVEAIPGGLFGDEVAAVDVLGDHVGALMADGILARRRVRRTKHR